MLARLLPRPSSPTAARILRQVFGQVPASFAFRLWDGTEVRVGSGPPVCTAVVRSPETFLDLMRDPSPGNFAEAYVASRIDLEGDLFKAMEVANAVEVLRLTRRQRLRVLASLFRASLVKG
jgi:hypothetical protein